MKYMTDKAFVITMINNLKVCFILNKFPDILGRPALNTFIYFYNSERNQKVVAHVDVRYCNSITLTLALGRVLNNVEKNW